MTAVPLVYRKMPSRTHHLSDQRTNPHRYHSPPTRPRFPWSVSYRNILGANDVIVDATS